ncbi:discoidin domain-containing protein [Echinicola shivajiensis]|uniref:discoidin domain-containing protein n=1 Tax=Echinicola shivajiensis TaxID=1035916 RepID=UPI001BFC0103|nr:discoidin domain-containing protein [Echinicola shivajiensis]
MALGNELSHDDNTPKNRVVNALREHDPRRLYSTQAGHVDKKHSSSDIRYNKEWENGESCNLPREELILTNNFDFSDGKSQNEPPLIIHENGQWVMYPGFDFMDKYTGVKQPDNFYPLFERLKENGLEKQDSAMALASGKHGVWHIKQVFESMYRTEGLAGFQYLGLQDFPGQSEAMVGILDPFWDSKGYISPEDFRNFCQSVVPLLRFEKWVYRQDETFEAQASLSNFGPKDMQETPIHWRIITSTGKEVQKGQFNIQQLPQGKISKIGHIKLPLENLKAPGAYKVELELKGTPYKNNWEFFVYPEQTAVAPQSVYITENLDQKAKDKLENGEKVLLIWPKDGFGKNVQKVSFTPQFWSFNRGALGRTYPGTAGMLCDPNHPVFEAFPTNFYADPRWMHLIHYANAFILNDLQKIDPLVQIIDDYHRNNKLAALFETKVGKGKLVVCGLNIHADLEQRPEAATLKKSILNYMESNQFSPNTAMSWNELTSFLPDPNSIDRVVEGSSRWPLHDYRDVLDGNPDTFWSSEWNGEWRASYSHHIVIEFGTEKNIAECIYTPRQDSENGRVRKYEIYVSKDGKTWSKPIASGEFENSTEKQIVRFDQSYPTKFVKFVSVSEVNNRKWAAIADLQFN